MEKKLNIRVREDVDIYEGVLRHGNFLDCGASKSAFEWNGTCIKLPIGYEELESNPFTLNCEYPYEYEDFNPFIHQVVANEHPELVWSIGQIIFEIMVWEHLKELEAMGYDISGFARIKDYYLDKNGIPVIEQEFISCSLNVTRSMPCPSGTLFMEQNSKVLNALEDMDFYLTDLRSGNMGYTEEGKLKCFDFGISNGSAIYKYDSYENYGYNSDDDYEEDFPILV